MTLYNGDCLDVMRGMAEQRIDNHTTQTEIAI